MVSVKVLSVFFHEWLLSKAAVPPAFDPKIFTPRIMPCSGNNFYLAHAFMFGLRTIIFSVGPFKDFDEFVKITSFF